MSVEISLNKKCWVDFSSKRNISKKARWSGIDYLPIEISSKEYVEMTWNLLMFGLQHIDVISTSVEFESIFYVHWLGSHLSKKLL